MVDDHLRISGKLQFNPRKIINEVIDPIANGEKPTLHITEFGLEILNFVFITYVLFIVFDYIENKL